MGINLADLYVIFGVVVFYVGAASLLLYCAINGAVYGWKRQEITESAAPMKTYWQREAELRKRQEDKERAQRQARREKDAARWEAALARVAEQKARQPEIRAQRERARASV